MRCPSCSGGAVENLGALTGIPGLFDLPDPGSLYHCKTCHLYFRRPFFNTDELSEAYRRIPATHWRTPENRTDHRLAVDAVMALKQLGKILDVGCYRGDFLQLLPERFSKYGIEPSEAAASIAEGKGVQICARTLETMDAKAPFFDVITLIDVLEHMPYPFLALSRLAPLLNRGGIVLLSTGNTDALPWRLMRRDYWYYSTEHVSFFNPRWFRWAARQTGLSLIDMKAFSHQEGSVLDRWRQLAQCLTYITLKYFDGQPFARRMLSKIYPFSRAIHWHSAPSAHRWKDHLLVTLRPAHPWTDRQALPRS